MGEESKMNWRKYLTPAVIVMVIFALMGWIGTSICEDIKDNKVAIEKSDEKQTHAIKSLDEEKVDNQTMQLMIQLQQQQIEVNKKEFDRVYEEMRRDKTGG